MTTDCIEKMDGATLMSPTGEIEVIKWNQSDKNCTSSNGHLGLALNRVIPIDLHVKMPVFTAEIGTVTGW